MIVKLLTEYHLEFLSFKGGCTCQNATLLEITCHSSCIICFSGFSCRLDLEFLTGSVTLTGMYESRQVRAFKFFLTPATFVVC